MKIGIISPVGWRTPPEHFGPYERVAYLITEGLIKEGIDVKLFATGNSKTNAELSSVVPIGYMEDKNLIPQIMEVLHLGHVFSNLEKLSLLHNHCGYMPLLFSPFIKIPMVTTIHGFSSPQVIPIYEKYKEYNYYISVSNSDRAKSLEYEATVYHGIDIEAFTFCEKPGSYLLFFGRIHHEKGTREAVRIAKAAKKKLIIAGLIQDNAYFDKYVKPELGDNIKYVGSIGPERRDELLRNAYCLMHPINFREPFGLTVVEAMACGTPVIAYPLGSMTELIVDGKTGFLPRNEEEFIEAIKKVKDISRRECRCEVEERFTVKRMVKDYIRVYENILRKTKK